MALCLGPHLGQHVTHLVAAGWTQARFDAVSYNFAFPGGGDSGVSWLAQTYNGWLIGSGFEYAFDWLPLPGPFLKTEYRYSQYNNVSVPLTGSPGGGGRRVQLAHAR